VVVVVVIVVWAEAAPTMNKRGKRGSFMGGFYLGQVNLLKAADGSDHHETRWS